MNIFPVTSIMLLILVGCSPTTVKPAFPDSLPQSAGLWAAWLNDAPDKRRKYKYNVIITPTAFFRGGSPEKLLEEPKQLPDGWVSFNMRDIGKKFNGETITFKQEATNRLQVTLEKNSRNRIYITFGVLKKLDAPKFEKACIIRKFSKIELLGEWLLHNNKATLFFASDSLDLGAGVMSVKNYQYNNYGQGQLEFHMPYANMDKITITALGMGFAILHVYDSAGAIVKEELLSKPDTLCIKNYRQWLKTVNYNLAK